MNFCVFHRCPFWFSLVVQIKSKWFYPNQFRLQSREYIGISYIQTKIKTSISFYEYLLNHFLRHIPSFNFSQNLEQALRVTHRLSYTIKTSSVGVWHSSNRNSKTSYKILIGQIHLFHYYLFLFVFVFSICISKMETGKPTKCWLVKSTCYFRTSFRFIVFLKNKIYTCKQVQLYQQIALLQRKSQYSLNIWLFWTWILNIWNWTPPH